MTYLPHTEADQEAMLAAIGVEFVTDLFHDVPEAHRFPVMSLPEPLSEMEIMAELEAMSEENLDTGHLTSFLGAGAYNHYVPRVVDHVIGRSEFYTAYTPYQPEISQGTLQSIFEYQSMVCSLTGMEVANASHYDGATSAAEAVIMALNVGRLRRKRVVLSPAVHPEYRAVIRTYTQGMDLDIVGDDAGPGGQLLDVVDLVERLDASAACLVIQSPNFFGQIEDLEGLAQRVHAVGAMLIVVTDPISLGLYRPPGAFDADIVVAEGQAFGGGLNYGGPYLGMFACREKDVRRMAGRLVGETVDADGQRGYVLTLATREQHIRRARATSNICTNQALCALAAAVHMAALGKRGLRQLAELCYHKAHYAAARIDELEGYTLDGSRPFFKEFVIGCPMPVRQLNAFLLEEWGIIGGYHLGRDYSHLQNHALLCVTEVISREEIDRLVQALAEAREEVR